MASGSGPRHYRIFIAEDNPADVYLLRRALEQTGLSFDLTVVADGAEALQFVHAEGPYAAAPAPDLMILDLNLPKEEGVTVLAETRNNPRLEGVPVAVLTSSASPQDRKRTLEFHIAEYLVKPFDLSGFLKIGEIVKNLLLPSGVS